MKRRDLIKVVSKSLRVKIDYIFDHIGVIYLPPETPKPTVDKFVDTLRKCEVVTVENVDIEYYPASIRLQYVSFNLPVQQNPQVIRPNLKVIIPIIFKAHRIRLLSESSGCSVIVFSRLGTIKFTNLMKTLGLCDVSISSVEQVGNDKTILQFEV